LTSAFGRLVRLGVAEVPSYLDSIGLELIGDCFPVIQLWVYFLVLFQVVPGRLVLLDWLVTVGTLLLQDHMPVPRQGCNWPLPNSARDALLIDYTVLVRTLASGHRTLPLLMLLLEFVEKELVTYQLLVLLAIVCLQRASSIVPIGCTRHSVLIDFPFHYGLLF